MQISEVQQKIEDSEVFKEFHKKHKDYYLTHFFSMFVPQGQAPWQVGYYSKKTDKIVVFELAKSVIRHEEEEAFKKKKFVKQLKPEKAIELEKALEILEKFRKENHPKELEQQKICILQNIEEGTVWNMTLISAQFNMLNLKIRASDGKILKHSFDSILRLGKDKI